MSEKNEKFHELSRKRVDNIANAIRILSNLAAPGYDWTPEEVMTYFREIDAARDEALMRFKETKRWRTSEPPIDETPPAAALPAEDTAEPTEDIEADAEASSDTAVEAEDQAAPVPAKINPGTPRNHPRNMTIAQVIAECAAGEKDMMAEMIILQRRVIYDQAQRLGEQATYPTVPAAA